MKLNQCQSRYVYLSVALPFTKLHVTSLIQSLTDRLVVVVVVVVVYCVAAIMNCSAVILTKSST